MQGGQHILSVPDAKGKERRPKRMGVYHLVPIPAQPFGEIGHCLHVLPPAIPAVNPGTVCHPEVNQDAKEAKTEQHRIEQIEKVSSLNRATRPTSFFFLIAR